MHKAIRYRGMRTLFWQRFCTGYWLGQGQSDREFRVHGQLIACRHHALAAHYEKRTSGAVPCRRKRMKESSVVPIRGAGTGRLGYVL